MKLRIARLSLAFAAMVLAWPAAAQDDLQASDCATASAPRDPVSNPETRRGTMDEQFCTQLDRLPNGRSLELYGGTIDGGQRHSAEPLQGFTRDELERQDGFFGLRLRLPY